MRYAYASVAVRPAKSSDFGDLCRLIDSAIETLQSAYLTPAQVAASRSFMGLDTQLIVDGTYLVAEDADRIVGCGGWSRRATLYGGDDSLVVRDAVLLDPAINAARIRAMYTDPTAVRRGIGMLILTACEAAAAAAGFKVVELMATLSGEPLYHRAGYLPIEPVEVVANGISVPFIRMRKSLDLGQASETQEEGISV